jgi:hypothetical protein
MPRAILVVTSFFLALWHTKGFGRVVCALCIRRVEDVTQLVAGSGRIFAQRRHQISEQWLAQNKGRVEFSRPYSHSILSTHRNALIYKRKIFLLAV